jgi:hypothetical protein
LEAQFVDISCNMKLIMKDLASKLLTFKDDGGSNSKIISEGKLGDQEEQGNESQKES